MADERRIRSRIREIASRRKNVTLDELEWVVSQLAQFHVVKRRAARHGMLIRIDDRRFMVNAHHPGSKQVKGYSVDEFLDAMTDLGWFEG
jgi:phage protein D